MCWIKKQNVLKAKIIVFVNNLFCYGSNSFHEVFKWAFQFLFFLSWQLNEENRRLNIIYFWLLNSAKFFYVSTTQFCLVQNGIDQCSRRSNGVILEELSNLYWVTMKLFFCGGRGVAGGRSCDCFHCVTHYFPCLGGRLGTRHQLVQYKALKTLSISAKSGR